MNNFLTCILVESIDLVKTAGPETNYTICGAPVFLYTLDELKKLEANQIILSCKTEKFMNLTLNEYEKIKVTDKNISDIIKNITENNKTGTLLIATADVPAITAKTLKEAYEYHISKNNKITDLTLNDRDHSDNDFLGIYFINIEKFLDFISSAVSQDNEDLIGKISSDKPDLYIVSDNRENIKVKDSFTLNLAEQVILRRIIKRHMENGVIFHLPDTSFIHKDVKIGSGTVIYPGTILEGNTIIGNNCEIGPYSRIEDSVIADNVKFMNSVMIKSQIGDNTTVGPFAYIRPGSKIGRNIKIGDFVEIKNAVIDDYTKVSHLSYVGDADVGKSVNFGCGSVIVNYDGKKKHRTKVGNYAFIGCNANLVSPVIINDNAYVAAGSTITEEVPEYALAIARSRQTIIENWVKRKGLNKK
ncbi:MAG: bifunctional UDP-N-acetylglucosamine diphosphorylase/glucosamine-1-phosphate N-acetyltransferase GlmU [Clostridiaceae bacterium]|nr:bifunctional UDP-N-acetylglucosamine diphosphorylase/glucosamine-1-phosphate N-acetyltransferase GlmU [Clostridiaceae bacterium]